MPDSSDPTLAELLQLYTDDALTADQAEQLNELLRADAANRDAFVEYCVHTQLLRELLSPSEPPGIVSGESPPDTRRLPAWWIPVAAAGSLAACLMVAVAAWWVLRADPPAVVDEDPRPPVPREQPEPRPQDIQLAGWRVTPTGSAEFELLAPRHVRLVRGELLVESTGAQPAAGNAADSPLRIETPHGEAIARGTRFYVGAHDLERLEEPEMKRSLTRVFVLTGVVTLTTALGSVDGGSGELLAAGPDQAPTKLVVQANSDFAWSMYQQLAKENDGENLFFSPYSLSVALAMTAEGARGETAREMGEVLQFPGGLRRMGNEDQLIPWETSLIHTGMADLQSKLSGGVTDKAAVARIEGQKKALRQRLTQVQAALKSAEDFDRLFKLEAEHEDLIAKIAELDSQINQYQLSIANALWGEQTYPFRDKYVDIITRHYDTGGVFKVDFRDNHEVQRLKINDWVEDHTQGRIKDLLPPRSLTKLTRLVLTNAIYFKGDWSTPFEAELTREEPFTHADGRRTRLPIMFAPEHESAHYAAFNADGSLFKTPEWVNADQTEGLYPGPGGFAMLELPYKGEDLSMVIIVPNRADGLAVLERKLSPASVSKWIEQTKRRPTDVYLPKFKFESEYSLADTLKALGMRRAFIKPDQKDGAEFQGMCESDDPLYWLYITQVIHKAFIEVNEQGTEAAAATAVVLDALGGAPEDVEFTPEFRADRPFVYLIREKSTGTILFLGRMMDPGA